MNRISQAVVLACAIFLVAVLAVLGIVPEALARYAPLAAVPFIVLRQPSCWVLGKGQAL